MPCTFYNWFIYFGAWLNQISFAIVCTNIALSLIKPHIELKRLHVVYHIIIIIPPIIIMIVTTATGYAGYGAGIFTCYFGMKSIMGVDNGLMLVLTMIPFLTSIAWGYFMIVVTFVILISRMGMHGVVKQWRFVLFALVYGTAILLSLIFPAITLRIKTSEAKQYYVCLVTNWIASQFSRHPKVIYLLIGNTGMRN